MHPSQRVAVVGAGLAGLGVVRGLRERGYDGRITLLGAEPHPPYDRPPLSKAVLLDDPPPDPVLEADWAALDVDLRLGEPALGLTVPGVAAADGEMLADAVVLACGAEPVRLPGDGGAVHLRTREDAARLRAALAPGARVVVVGAGWIGAEVATAAARRGCSVTVVEAAPSPLSAALPAEVGSVTARWYEQGGADLRCGTAVEAVDPDGVRLETGERLPADLVVVGVGVRPVTGWLAGSGVDVDGGVLVDEHLRATGRPATWAVGDVAARWSPRYGDRVRGEHWDDALHAPAVVAANLLGGRETYDPVPYVWSEQWGRMLQWCGRAGDPADTLTVWRGEPGDPAGWAVAFLAADSSVRGFLAVDRPRDLVQARRLATRGTPVDAGALADPGVAVRDCAR
ncbi:MAG TPA: FAD-dependent oxidoreductase [Jiangellales bacterium]|nr:FAD-dependent oxidoreductase [Jiangellales bacterium]